ncbi:MAG: response regulator [Deltaproteobacteria bacterium]|nr:response regulator [Deltaproteobacteria bacterium]
MSNPSILVVDDDDNFRERLARAFRDRGFDVHTARNPAEAKEQASLDSPEYAVVDLRMPGGSGLELVRDLLAIDPATRVVVLTGYGSISTAVDAIHLGATNYLPKPADADDVLAAFQRSEQPLIPTSNHREDDVPSLARAEWEHINRVLSDAGGNISLAAKRLGIHRRSLQRKLQKYPPSR